MNKKAIIFLFTIAPLFLFSQTKGTVYLLPGQGADRRLFDSLTIDNNYKVKVVEYGTPSKELNMQLFAKEISKQIDTTEDYILIGVSMGGMLCVELSEILNPTKTIIISSAKNNTELPKRYRFQKNIPVYKIVPGSVIKIGAKTLQPIVEPDRNNNEETFKSMLSSKSSTYMSRTVSLIINWDRTVNNSEIIHIHGSNDHTIPLRNIKNPNNS